MHIQTNLNFPFAPQRVTADLEIGQQDIFAMRAATEMTNKNDTKDYSVLAKRNLLMNKAVSVLGSSSRKRGAEGKAP
jgi:hypothetical protein